LTASAHRYLSDQNDCSTLSDDILLSSSVSLANCQVATVNAVIVSTLKALCLAEDADHAGWSLLRPDLGLIEHLSSGIGGLALDVANGFHSNQLPWCQSSLLTGRPVLLNNLTELPAEAAADRAFLEHQGMHSVAIVAIDAGDSHRSVLTILRQTPSLCWSKRLAKQCALLGSAFLSARERRVMHQQKENSDSNFRELFRSASIGMAVEDTSGGLLYVNEALCTMLGYTESEMIQRRCVDFSHPEDHATEAILFEQLFRREIRTYNIEKRFLHRSGGIVWARVTVTLLRESSNGAHLILGIAEDITLQKNAVEKLASSQKQVSALASRLIFSQEDERRSIARDLHDDIGQRLSMVTSEIHYLNSRPTDNGGDLVTSFERLGEELDTLVTDLHNISHRLHSSKLQHLGVKAALLELCGRLRNSGLCVHLDLSAALDPMPENTAVCLLRVAQEALNNVLKHSGVSRATLTLSKTETGYFMVIEDAGRCFDTQACPEGLGLISMTERVRPLQGFLTVHSSNNHGTEVVAWVPFIASGPAFSQLQSEAS
jgi:PAS domain S-box-containing protein